jgi:hypothetical protein
MNEVYDQREALFSSRTCDLLPHQPHLNYCPCPDCRAHYAPSWPCGRPRRSWETPVPMPLDYPLNWPQYTCGVAVGNTDPQQAMNHGAMSGVGATNLCN